MLKQMEVQEIIIDFFRKGKPQRSIAKELKIHRKTVKKYINLYKTSLSAGEIIVPKYKSENRKKHKLTDAVIAAIDKLLLLNEQRISDGMYKQQLKKVDIFEALQTDGFDIGYSSVCNYINVKKNKNREKFIKQHYLPGKIVEFDWGMVKLKIDGKIQKLKIGIFTLAYSNHRFAMLFENEQMNSFLEAHVHYLSYIGGVPLCFVYDNMKTAVAKFTYKQKDKKPTDDLLKISSYYAFDFRFTGAAKGNEKGHVEKSVEYIRRKCFATKIEFDSIAQANDLILEKLKTLNQKTSQTANKSIAELFAEEQKYFKTLPVNEYQTAITKTVCLNKFNCFNFASNFYSVPENCADRKVEIKIFSQQILVYNSANQLIATHSRSYKKNDWSIDIQHFMFTLRTKPGALHSSFALKQAPIILQEIYKKYYENNSKDFIETAIKCKEYNYDLLQWKTAIERYKSKTNNDVNCSIIIASIQQNTINIQTLEQKNNEEQSHQNQQIYDASKQQLQEVQQMF